MAADRIDDPGKSDSPHRGASRGITHRPQGIAASPGTAGARRVLTAVAAAAMAAAALAGINITTAATAHAATDEFAYTGTPQTWQVPEGVTSVSIELAGGSGANLVGPPTREGRGAVLTWDDIPVSADVECTFAIGQGGQVDVSNVQNSPGGGAASVVTCSDGSGTVFEAIAGGGGGASAANGGDGGLPAGGDGASAQEGTTGGGGGSNTTPGAGGKGGADGGDGTTAGTIGGAGGLSVAQECPGATPGGAGGANPNPIYAGGAGGGLCVLDGRGGSGGGGGSFGGGGGNGASNARTGGGGGGASQWFVTPTSTGYQDYLTREGSGRDGYASVTYIALPGAPTNLSAAGGNAQATISFTPGSDGYTNITNYEYTLNAGDTWTPFNPAQTDSPVTISDLTNGTEYQIALRAVNVAGVSPASAPVAVTPLTTPDAPTAVTATGGYGQVTVDFTAPASDGGAAITNYEYSTDGGTTWTAFAPVVTSGPVVIGGLTNGISYQVALRAVNTAGAGAASQPIPVTPQGAQFNAVQPYRAYDSRWADGPLGGGQSRTVSTAVPPEAIAVAYNLTATGMTGSGYLAVTPAGSPAPTTSTLNYTAAGQTWANAFTSGVNDSGELTVTAKGARTEFVVDVVGYYVPPAAPTVTTVDARANKPDASLFVPLTPTRAYDSRTAEGPLSGGQSRTVDITAGGAVPADATAIAYTITETGTVGRGFLSVGPAGGETPVVSSINWFTANQTTANSSVVAINAGAVDVTAGTRPGGSAQFVIDVLGYYTPAALAPADALAFTAIDPARAYDSRIDQPLGPITGGTNFTTSMAVAGVPASAEAVSYNLTITSTQTSGYLTTTPGDVISPPLASTINWWRTNQTLANGSVVGIPSPVGDDRAAVSDPLSLPVTTFAAGGSTQYLIDVAGYFTPEVNAPEPPGGESGGGSGAGQLSFEFTYGSGAQYWSPEARSALTSASATFAANFKTSSPVTVSVAVTARSDAGSSSLAGTAGDMVSADPGFVDSVVQRKVLTGVDANGAAADITLDWNFAVPWATGDSVPSNQYDLKSVAMRELAHAFGFDSNLAQPGSNEGRNWTRFDGYLVDSQGTPPIDGQYRWQVAYNSNLTGGNGGLYFGGSNAVAAYGGPMPLHTPSPWESGASVSHLDPQLGQWLTTAAVDRGPGPRTLSPVEVAILKDLGYTPVVG